jgi:hypothetical protein
VIGFLSWLGAVLGRRVSALRCRVEGDHEWDNDDLFTVEWGHVDFVWCKRCGFWLLEDVDDDQEVE